MHKSVVNETLKEKGISGQNKLRLTRRQNTDTLSSLKIALLFCISNENALLDIQVLVDKARQDNEYINVFVYFQQNISDELKISQAMMLINKKDFNIFGRLKKKKVSQLSKNQYDLLISFGLQIDKKCAKTIKSFRAKIKAGMVGENSDDFFDISIGNKAKPIDFETYYSQLMFYLCQLKIDLNGINN